MTMIDPKKIMQAAYYIDTGCSLKDVLSDYEIEQAILVLADVLFSMGEPQFDPGEFQE